MPPPFVPLVPASLSSAPDSSKLNLRIEVDLANPAETRKRIHAELMKAFEQRPDCRQLVHRFVRAGFDLNDKRQRIVDVAAAEEEAAAEAASSSSASSSSSVPDPTALSALKLQRESALLRVRELTEKKDRQFSQRAFEDEVKRETEAILARLGTSQLATDPVVAALKTALDAKQADLDATNQRLASAKTRLQQAQDAVKADLTQRVSISTLSLNEQIGQVSSSVVSSPSLVQARKEAELEVQKRSEELKRFQDEIARLNGSRNTAEESARQTLRERAEAEARCALEVQQQALSRELSEACETVKKLSDEMDNAEITSQQREANLHRDRTRQVNSKAISLFKLNRQYFRHKTWEEQESGVAQLSTCIDTLAGSLKQRLDGGARGSSALLEQAVAAASSELESSVTSLIRCSASEDNLVRHMPLASVIYLLVQTGITDDELQRWDNVRFVLKTRFNTVWAFRDKDVNDLNRWNMLYKLGEMAACFRQVLEWSMPFTDFWSSVLGGRQGLGVDRQYRVWQGLYRLLTAVRDNHSRDDVLRALDLDDAVRNNVTLPLDVYAEMREMWGAGVRPDKLFPIIPSNEQTGERPQPELEERVEEWQEDAEDLVQREEQKEEQKERVRPHKVRRVAQPSESSSAFSDADAPSPAQAVRSKKTANSRMRANKQ